MWLEGVSGSVITHSSARLWHVNWRRGREIQYIYSAIDLLTDTVYVFTVTAFLLLLLDCSTESRVCWSGQQKIVKKCLWFPYQRWSSSLQLNIQARTPIILQTCLQYLCLPPIYPCPAHNLKFKETDWHLLAQHIVRWSAMKTNIVCAFCL